MKLLEKIKRHSLVLDFALCCASIIFAAIICQIWPSWRMVGLVFLINMACFLGFRTFKSNWLFFGIFDLVSLIKAQAFVSSLALFGSYFLESSYSIRLVVVYFFGSVMFMAGARLLCRFLINQNSFGRSGVLIYGAGNAGEQIVRQAKDKNDAHLRVLAILDDNKEKWGQSIHGVEIIGGLEQLEYFIKNNKVKEVLIAIPSANSQEMRRISSECLRVGVKFRTLPNTLKIVDDKVDTSHVRDVDVEDLLGRKPVKIDEEKIGRLISAKTVMVTGAGGSIGSELCHQILKFKPKTLIMFDICEFFLFELEQNLRIAFSEMKIISIIGDVRDRKRLTKIIEKFRPSVLFHAAAYKHVPMMEFNPVEAVKTNVRGTKNVMECCLENQVERVVLISTDKAVRPTSIMGATKRIAEMVGQKLAMESESTKFVLVRFGNVLGSRGSVVPSFKKQIAAGGPITVTHPEMTRYFMTIPEASQLVLETGAIAETKTEIFILDMGEPVKILDLAKDLIQLSGFEPGKEIEIEFTGLRPGEKIHEELLSDEEKSTPTGHEKVRSYEVRALDSEFTAQVESLLLLADEEKDLEVKEQIKRIVPEFLEKES